jgi:hypothetical protein
MGEFEDERRLAVRIETVLRAHIASKRQRESDISAFASALFERMVKSETLRLTREATLYDIKTRIVTRKAGKFWRSWARARASVKEQRMRDQEEMYGRMNTMGLGGSRDVAVVLHEEGNEQRLGEMGTDHGDLGADVMLREVSCELPRARLIADKQSARQNDLFHAPSTFLSIVAQHVGAVYGNLHDDLEVPASPVSDISHARRGGTRWQTVISTSAGSATPPNEAATRWLTRKFSPVDEDDFERYGLRFETQVLGQNDEPSSRSSVGLIVFEIPLRPELLDEIDA